MKKIILSIVILAVAGSNTWGQKLDRSVRPKPGAAPEIKLGKTESFTLPNGMKVFVVENHKLPTVAFDIQLDIKPELEGSMAGYRDMMSELMTSGTKTRTNDQLNEQIDLIGANIGATSDKITGSGLKKHQERILELMSDIAINSDFKQTELDKIKNRAKSGLEAAKNEPDQMLNNVSSVLNFGTDHPKGEVSTEATTDKITLEACKNYYESYFRPNVAYMAVVGDITMAEAKPLIEKYFGNWQKKDVPVAKYPTPHAPQGTRVAFVPREGAVQSVINVTYPVDLVQGSPDVIKARVANTILGGGSQGRLFLNLREKHGWTYGSYSDITIDELGSTFTGYAKCRNAVTDSSITELLHEMSNMQNEKVSNENLQNTITYLTGNFAIGLESPERVAQFAINIERYHMPKDYYQNYLKNLAAVTPDDVQSIARKYIDPNNANIVIVGNKDEVAKKISVFAKDGKVSYYDNYGRPIQAATQKAVPANVTINEVMKKYIAALGGEKVINSIKDIKIVSSGEFQNIALTITAEKKSPSKMNMSISGMGMTFQKMVLNGDKGYQEVQGKRTDMTADDLAENQEEADIQSILHPEKYGIKRTVKAMDNVNGSDAYVVEAVNAKGKKSTEYYDVQSGLLVKKVSTATAAEGEPTSTETVEYLDYKEVTGGYKVPYTVKEAAGPQIITAKVQSVDINKGIDDAEFK
ncbi:MAG: insulinase family protein [Bacteroidota bacterium]